MISFDDTTLDGPQHFRQIANWNPPEETKLIDQQKDDWALQNGQHLIRICQEAVFYNKENWEEQLRGTIIYLQTQSSPKVTKIGKCYETT